MSESPENPVISLFKSEKTIIFISPILAYLCAFLYEAGFLNYFGIPIEFIRVELTTIVVTAGVVLSVILISYFLANLGIIFLHPLLREYKLSNKLQNIIMFSLTFVGIGVFVFTFSVTSAMSYCAGAITSLIIFTILSYKGCLNTKAECDENKRNIRRKLAILLLSFFSLFIFWKGGFNEAHIRGAFVVIKTSPEKVVLRIYGDRLICASFDRVTKKIQRDFTIINLTKDFSSDFNYENMGPLRIVDL